MPMYLGNTFVKGLYLGDSPYDGFALGSDTDAEDYGVIQYRDPSPSGDSASWSIQSGWTVIGADSNGIKFSLLTFSQLVDARLSFTAVIGRKYQFKCEFSAASDNFPMFFSIFQGAAAEGGTTLNRGSTFDYTTTAFRTDMALAFINFNLSSPADMYLDNIYIREVS